MVLVKMNTKIIGRYAEQNELKEIYKSPRAELVAIYGRRRVGKTYLINTYFKQKKCVFFNSVGLRQGTMQTQLDNFKDALSETFYNKVALQKISTWQEAFKILTLNIEKITNEQVIVFLDELPWMATPRSGFLNALDYFWNKYWSNIPNLKLFICGSSASWIIKKIINDKGGLHNRVTRKIILRPFLLHEAQDYVSSLELELTSEQILEIYMSLGGIPFYLNSLKRNLSVIQNINNLCFRESGLLYNEFNLLFESLFKDAEAYKEIIRYVAENMYGMARSTLEDKCKLSTNGGTLSERLQNLEDAGFIISFLPYGHTERGISYRVIDEYSLFYLHWIEPSKKGAIRFNPSSNFWLDTSKTPKWHAWSGYAFEAVCYKHVNLIQTALKIPASSIAISWRYHPIKPDEQGAQIDLAFDRTDDSITICEIKYSTEPFVITKAYATNLKKKCEIFKKITRTKKQIFIAIIAANGLKENLYVDELISASVTLEDLMQAK